jgi:hypothetical protein
LRQASKVPPCGKPCEQSEQTAIEEEDRDEPIEEPPEMNWNLDRHVERVVESMRVEEKREDQEI